MTQQIDRIHTPCKNCVFSKYENNTQVDCLLNYISKYKENNTEVLEVYDEEKEFFVINKKKCIGYRENKWFDQFELSNATLEEKISKYQELNRLHYLLVIDLKNLNFDQLIYFIKSIHSLKYPPLKIILIRHVNNNIFEYEKIIHAFKENKISIPWRIQTMVDNSLSYKDILHNIISINKQYRFIVSIEDFNEDLETIVNKANSIVHDDLQSFQIIGNKNKTCIILSGPVYRYSLKNDNKNILEDDTMYEFCDIGR